MRTLNKATIIGRAAASPVLRFTKGGTAVANLDLATNERRKDGHETTTWHRVVLWDKLAELSAKYVTKGRPIYVEGPLSQNEWQDAEGGRHRRTELMARQLILLGPASSADVVGDAVEPALGRRAADGEELEAVRDTIPF